MSVKEPIQTSHNQNLLRSCFASGRWGDNEEELILYARGAIPNEEEEEIIYNRTRTRLGVSPRTPQNGTGGGDLWLLNYTRQGLGAKAQIWVCVWEGTCVLIFFLAILVVGSQAKSVAALKSTWRQQHHNPYAVQNLSSEGREHHHVFII